MSSNLMDTEAGGEEQNQYESAANLSQPHKKSTGQLGDPSTTTSSSTADSGPSAERGAKTAANIRYGQGISEGGMGGQTTDSTGEATEQGYGRLADAGGETTAAVGREEQGYGGSADMDKDVGA